MLHHSKQWPMNTYFLDILFQKQSMKLWRPLIIKLKLTFLRLCRLLDVDASEFLLLRLRLDEHTDGDGFRLELLFLFGQKSFLNNPITITSTVQLVNPTESDKWSFLPPFKQTYVKNSKQRRNEYYTNVERDYCRRLDWKNHEAPHENDMHQLITCHFIPPGRDDITKRRTCYKRCTLCVCTII